MNKIPLAIALALSTVAGSVHAQDADLGRELSGYRRFIVYPHLQAGFDAMRSGDGRRAIAEFERARELAPRSPSTALYLAEAYRKFGQSQRANAVLAAQSRITPADARLRAVIAANQPARVLPQAMATRAAAKPAGSASVAAAAACTATSTAPACQAQAGYAALRARDPAGAAVVLRDPAFATSAEGLQLRHDLAQRAIAVRDWNLADAQFAELDRMGSLQPGERMQWFNALLAAGRVAQARALQERMPALATPAAELAVAQALSASGAHAALAEYLRRRSPAFADARDEQQWFGLLQAAFADAPEVLSAYAPRFAATRAMQARALLPAALARGDVEQARRWLARIPASQMRRQRFDLALLDRDPAAALVQAQAVLDGDNGAGQLDELSYRLLQAGGKAQAAQLLWQRYPFAGMAEAEGLMQRLALLAAESRDAVPPPVRARLRAPLATPALRSRQADLLTALEDCDGVLAVLADQSTAYPARSWHQIGHCLRERKPGLAQQAFEEAFRREASADNARALGYQAYATHDNATALRAWRSIAEPEMTPADLLAASHAAIAAQDTVAARAWLQRYRAIGGRDDDTYWWLLAQTLPETSPLEIIDALQRAVAQRPDVRYLRRLAALYAQQGRDAEALQALRQAVALAPDDADARSELGFALARSGEDREARDALEFALKASPDDPELVQQLAYVNASLGDREQARAYAQTAIDQMAASGDAVDDDVARMRFGFQRLHENLGRRWSVSSDLSLGNSDAIVTQSAGTLSVGRSYGQVEAGYRLLPGHPGNPEWLTAYTRAYGGASGGGLWPVHGGTLGLGLRWKPWRNQVVYFSVEQQVPLDRRFGARADTMLRASASFLNQGAHSDDWHPDGNGWWAQNLYLDAARYLRRGQTLGVADYRVSRHMKLAEGQTLEPYTHLQLGLQERGAGSSGFDRDLRAGVGLRWNLWYGQSGYDAYPRKLSVGIEFQHVLSSYFRDRSAVVVSIGSRW